MIEYRDAPRTNIVEFAIDGKIGKEEFDALVAKLQDAIRQHGKVRLLEHVRSFGGLPPSRLWEDIKFEFKHLGDFSHVAVVADATWIAVLAKLVNPILSAEVRHFDEAEIDAAREWLRTAT